MESRLHIEGPVEEVTKMGLSQGSALSRLVNGLKREQHDYRASLEVFPALNIDKLAADMALAKIGVERGAKEEPGSATVAFDDVEIGEERRPWHVA
jgi:hypothetical protein